MPRYLIELTHEDEYQGCVKTLKSIEKYGAHLLTHLDWGCKAGTHSGWLIVEVGSRGEVIQMVPPVFRQEVRVVELNKFTRDDISSLVSDLKDRMGSAKSLPGHASDHPSRIRAGLETFRRQLGVDGR